MAYSKFTDLKKVVTLFGLKTQRANLFPADIPALEPSAWVIESIDMAYHLLGFASEKERSERLASPILAELLKKNKDQFTIYSGHELNVDKSLGLTGECDFMLAMGKKVIDYVEAPLFSVVEAKRQDIEHGTAQCTAQLIGAQRFNEADGYRFPFLYGAISDGVKWRFIKLEDKKLWIDEDFYLTGNLPKLLGILQYILDDCKKISQ